MSGFVLHPAAFADLEEIWEFIAPDSLDAADRVLEEIFEAIQSSSLFLRLAISVPTMLLFSLA
jgi:plasmid stabilization system protein ParE